MSSRVPGSRWITVDAVVLAPAVFAEPTIAQPAGAVTGEEAAKLDPTHADVHYWLGMANATEGNRAEAARSLRRYPDLTADGQYADSAADTLKQIGQ